MQLTLYNSSGGLNLDSDQLMHIFLKADLRVRTVQGENLLGLILTCNKKEALNLSSKQFMELVAMAATADLPKIMVHTVPLAIYLARNNKKNNITLSGPQMFQILDGADINTTCGPRVDEVAGLNLAMVLAQCWKEQGLFNTQEDLLDYLEAKIKAKGHSPGMWLSETEPAYRQNSTRAAWSKLKAMLDERLLNRAFARASLELQNKKN